MNVSQLRNLSLKLINQYSSDGTVLAESDIADFKLTFVDNLNTAQNKFAEKDKIESLPYSITQNPIPNILGDTFNIVQHLATDLSYSATGAKSYYFEIDHPGTVYIEEETASGTWTTLTTLTLTPTSFTEYKGLITASNVANSIRLRFSGSYPYNIRRQALYAYTFASASDVPQYKPWNEYALPSDYVETKMIDYYGDNQYRSYLSDYYIQNKTLFVKYDIVGSFDIYYYKRPTVLVNDTDIPEIQIQNHNYLAYFPAGAWLFANGKQSDGIVLTNQFDSFLQEFRLRNDEFKAEIVNSKGW